MQFFNIDFITLCKQLLPVRLRKARQLAWVNSLTKPILTLFGTFMNNRAANNYYIAHTGQICHLEAVLKEHFNPPVGRFEIHNGSYCEPLYVFLTSEPRVVHLITEGEIAPGSPPYDAPHYLYTDTEIYDPGILFKVYYPAGFSYGIDEENEIKSLINKYRLVSRVSYEVLEGPAPPLVV